MPAAFTESPSTRISLLTRIRDSDNSNAWELFVRTYTPLVTRYCGRWGLQDADVCDVTQTVFAIVARSASAFEYDPSRGRFRSWLGTITCREIRRNQARAARVGQGTGGDDLTLRLQGSDLDAAWMDEFNARIYECALERICPSFDEEIWQAFVLSWEEDLKQQGWWYPDSFGIEVKIERRAETWSVTGRIKIR